MNLLIADDEKEILRFLRLYLEKDHYTIFEAYDGLQAWDIIQNNDISLAILDIMMPKLDGYELIQKIRESYNFPIILLTAKSANEDIILGLGLGADDYITKPFHPTEVCARVEANLRRYYSLGNAAGTTESALLQCKDLVMDTNECTLYRKTDISKKEINLTSMEYKILRLFMMNPGKVFTKQEIYESVWQDSYITDDNNIMAYISKIREKLGDQSYIKTIRGLGYRFIK